MAVFCLFAFFGFFRLSLWQWLYGVRGGHSKIESLFQSQWPVSRDHIYKSKDYVWSVLFLQISVSCPIQPPLRRHSNRSTRHLINSPHGSFIEYLLLVNEMNLGTVLEAVGCLCVWKGEEVCKQRFCGQMSELATCF